MADNLIFPIGFDLQQAVEKAGKEWDKTYAKRLETYLAKRPVKVKLNFENLNDVKTRLAQLKIEPITPETKASIKELARELQVLAKALEQVQKYSKNPAQLGQQNFRNDVQLEKLRQANERLEIQKRRVALAEQKHAEAMKRSASASKQLSSGFQTQEGYVSRLVKRLAVYASFSAVSGLLTNIRQVTAEFELQRVSLGAIIQDQERANQLFGEIKSFALKSPVSILDLTKYTKQIAAYGVETEKLFDTTKMLTDVSVGLGTPLSQLALAFGQIRSSSVLRLAETRQLTEAGIPALELLAKQLEKTYGRFVSTAEVMELISKRAISFEMVEQMFKDMTSAGGAFYNMQEKQGNTLFGLWAKLGDAASVMYDEIGNTSSVNSGMKEAIRLLSDLMRNWRNVGIVVAESAAVFAIWKLQAVNAALVTNALTAAEVRALAVKKVHYKMQPAIIRGIIGETNARKLSIITVRAHAAAVRASATSTNIFTKAWYSLKAAFLSNPFGIALTALAAIATYLMFADDKVKRFKEDLDSIKESGAVEATKSAYNFEQLAEKAVNAADGSMEQKDALDELQRTYKDMIPIQDLTIEKLKALKGHYDSLTQSIKEYVYQRNLQQQIDRIIEERTGTMTRIEQKLRDELKEGIKYQVSDAVHTKDLGIDDNQISALFSRIKTEAKNTTKDVQTIIRESVDEIFGYLSQEDRNILYAMGLNKLAGDTDGWLNTLQSIIELQRAMDGEIENASTSMSQYTGYLGEYKKELDNITESVKKYRLVNTKGEAVERDTFLFQQGQQNFKIKQWANSIKSDLENAGVTIQEGIFNLVDKINENDPTKISTIDFTKLMPMLDSPEVKQKLGNSYETFKNYVLSIQKLYDRIIPSDPIVQAVRNSMFAIGNATKGGMDVMKKHLWDGKGSIEDHLKTLKQSAATLENEIYKYSSYIKLFGTAGKTSLKMMGVDVDALTAEYDALTKQIEYVQQYVKETEKRGPNTTKSDNRLQNLQEIESTLTSINKKYEELSKTEGSAKALEYVKKNYASTLEYINKLGKQFKLNFSMPTDFKDLQSFRKAIQGVIEKLKMKGYEKAAIELELKIAEGNQAQLQKQIQAEMKAIADEISRTKTAKEFYEKILSTTGDDSLAGKVAESIFGQNGSELRKALAEQVRGMTNGIKLSDGIISADNIIDYKALRRFAEANKEELGGMYEELIKIANEGQKDLAKTYEGYLKDLEKAKTYSDKRIELARYTANKIAEIEASTLPQEEKERLTAGYKEREKQKQGELEWEAFKEMPMYVQMFDDLDNASETMLSNMKSKLTELQSVWGSTMNPTQLKELQSRLNDIDAQLAKKNPFKTLSDAMKQYKALSKGGTQADAERKLIEATDKRQAAQQKLNMALDVSRTAQKRYNEAVAKYGNGSEQAKSAKIFWDAAKQGVDDAGKLVEQTGLSEQEAQRLVNAWKKVKDAIGLSLGEVFQIAHSLGDLAGGIGKLTEVFGGSEEDVQYWNDIASSLNEVTSGIENMVQAALSGNPIGIVTSAVTAIPNMISGFAGLFSAGKVRNANKEIKRQQKILEQLEYTYNRLNDAADRLFGVDYLQNYNQQIKVLQSQQQAYLKQAQAERSKGKKEDKEKTKEFEEQARETADKIKELQDDLAAHFTGSDKQSAARDFVQQWLEAKVAFANTADAIRSKYKELIKNMIIEGAAAKVIDNILGPLYDRMGELLQKGDVQGAIDYLVNGMDAFVEQADSGLNILWKALEARGYDMKAMLGDVDSGYTGIAKDIAGATSEEINRAAAIGNTLMYHTAYLPQIYQEIAAWRAASMGVAITPTASDASVIDSTALQTEAMNHYRAIATNTAATVARLDSIATQLSKIVTTKNGRHGVNTFLNS